MKLLGEVISKYVSETIVVKRQNGPNDLKSTLRRVYGQTRLATSDWFSYAAPLFYRWFRETKVAHRGVTQSACCNSFTVARFFHLCPAVHR